MPQRDRFMKPKKQKPMRHLDKKEQDAFHEAFRSSFRPVEEDIKQKLECEIYGGGKINYPPNLRLGKKFLNEMRKIWGKTSPTLKKIKKTIITDYEKKKEE